MPISEVHVFVFQQQPKSPNVCVGPVFVNDLGFSDLANDRIEKLKTNLKKTKPQGSELIRSLKEIEDTLEGELSIEQASTCRSRFEVASFYRLGARSYIEHLGLSADDFSLTRDRIPELEKMVTEGLIEAEHNAYSIIMEKEFGLNQASVDEIEVSLRKWKVTSPSLPSYLWCTLNAAKIGELPERDRLFRCNISGSGRAFFFELAKEIAPDEFSCLKSVFGVYDWAKDPNIYNEWQASSQKYDDLLASTRQDQEKFLRNCSELVGDLRKALTPTQWKQIQQLRFFQIQRSRGFKNAINSQIAKDAFTSEELTELNELAMVIETAMLDSLRKDCIEIHNQLVNKLFEGINNESVDYLRKADFESGIPMLEAFLAK